MVAAALTLWLMFALSIGAPLVGAPRGVTRTAAGLCLAELVTLFAYSYGCEFGCTALGTVAGTAARTDVPVLATVFLGALVVGRVRAAFS